MSCSNPHLAVHLGSTDTGKKLIKFLPKRADMSLERLYSLYGRDKLLFIPCGKCPSCVKNYRLQWSLRCEAEAKCHEISCFVTLTYDDQHNDSLLHKDHLKQFIKMLRNRSKKIRYFGCGEYSPDGRPHYHIILFGYMPDDLSLISKSKTGFYLYKSRFIENLWRKGLCTVQEFDSAVAGYVAGYVDKKIDDRDSFLIMSNRPGIGHDYYIKNVMNLYHNDNFISKNGFVAPLPRYADKVADSFFYDLDPIKEKRFEKSKKMTAGKLADFGFEHIGELYKYLGDQEARRKKYARSL